MEESARRVRQPGLDGSEDVTASDVRLSKLITNYRRENERCTAKINELKQRLADYQENETALQQAHFNEKVSAKSFKVASQLSSSKNKDPYSRQS